MNHNPKGLYLERVGKGSLSRILHIKLPVSVVGRQKECNIKIDGQSRTVSRRHCQLTLENEKLYIENLSTSTSTYLNEDKVLQKTEVEIGDLIGLGTNPDLSDNVDSEERFVYKLCEPVTMCLSSDDDEVENNNGTRASPLVIVLSDERIIAPAAHHELTNGKDYTAAAAAPSHLNRPLCIDSPGFSSDASTATDHGRRALIDKIVSNKILESLQEKINKIKVKECIVLAKRLTNDEIIRLSNKSPISPPPPLPNNKTSSSCEEPSTSNDISNQKRIVVVPCKKHSDTLDFSRTKYEKEKLSNKIRKKVSKLVDSESEDYEDDEEDSSESSVTSADTKKLTESVKQSAGNRARAKSSTSERTRSVSRKRNPAKIVNRRKTISYRQNITEQRSINARRKTIDTDKPSDQYHLSRKLVALEQNHVGKKFDASTKANTEQIRSSHNENRKRTLDVPEKNNNEEKPAKYAKIVKSVLPPQSSSASSKETFDFPSLNISANNVTVRKDLNKQQGRRHQSLFYERSSDLTDRHRKSSTTEEAARNKEATLIKAQKEVRKRLRSIGDRPNSKPLALNEDRKQKLKELTVNQQQIPLPKEKTPEELDLNLKTAPKIGPVKVKYTPANRGEFLTQELPTKPKSAKSNAIKTDLLPQKKSALESFRERYVKSISSPPPENESEDLLNSIRISTPPLDFYNQPTTSTLKSDTLMVKLQNPTLSSGNETQTIPLELETFPFVPFAPMDAPTVIESNKVNIQLKTCLKSISGSSNNAKKKRVSFKCDDELVQCHFIEERLIKTLSQSNMTNVKPLKEIENSIWEEILSWDIKWLKMSTLPEKWHNKPMQYQNLNEYKTTLKSLIRIEILSKLKNASKEKGQRSQAGEKEFSNLMVRSKLDHGNRIRLTLSLKKTDKCFFQGMLVILRVKDHSKTSLSNDIEFFGFIYELKAEDLNYIATVDIMYKELPANVTVVKCKPLHYIWNDIKSLVAIENLQEKPLIENFLKPETNTLQSSWSTDLNIKTILNNDQKGIVNVITSECISNQKMSNIIALHSKAGTGKTKVLIESLINIIGCSKQDSGKKCSILVCALSNILVDLIAVQTYKQTSFPKTKFLLARIGDKEKMTPEAQKLHVSAGQYDSLNSYDAIFTTVTNAYELHNYKKNFDVCFIDDANCCIDSELAILLQLNITKLFLIGDLKQTQPFAHSHDLLDSNYDETFFARMINAFEGKLDEEKPILQITSQYRMNEELAKIADEFIYEKNSLSTVDEKQQHQISLKSFLVWEFNNETLGSCCKYLIKKNEISQDATIGIIVANEYSRNEISQEVKNDKRVQVQNIGKLNALEYDIIIIGCAQKSDVVYFSALNRINRAFTRAKQAVYIVGPSDLFNNEIINCRVWNNLVKYSKDNGCKQDVKEECKWN